jgi:hypothetical protein
VTLKTKATAKKVGDIIELVPQSLSEPGYELPTISRNVFGKKYRYYYCAGMYDPGPFRNSVSSQTPYINSYCPETGDFK